MEQKIAMICFLIITLMPNLVLRDLQLPKVDGLERTQTGARKQVFEKSSIRCAEKVNILTKTKETWSKLLNCKAVGLY